MEYETAEQDFEYMPMIILSSFEKLDDFLILSYLFQKQTLAFVALRDLPNERLIKLVSAVNYMIYFDNKPRGRYEIFRKIFLAFRDYNRSIVFSPDAAKKYANEIVIEPAILARLAIKANVPIVPVVLNWGRREQREKGKDKCSIWIGKKIFITPRSEEFRDIFYKRRGVRKYENLSEEEFREIGQRIFKKVEKRNQKDGSDISKEMAAGHI
ncbi:MAG: hypothetical protein PHN49_06440 [Candidatus Omnitrophica bacterium]|nr:hypothetical protein [Candidatus Omnitrophota bacterium]MDD5671257.1 hypothetical protein [Candidatus Omnitrophota bacterium]